MSALTSALIEYWRELPSRPVAARRRDLDEASRRVRRGEREPAALVPYALGDCDDEVVAGATAAYIDATPGPARAESLQDAAEWVRRGLAINRGAVFASLLLRGEDHVNEKLLPLRLTLGAEEVATVTRHAQRRRCERTRAFLEDWHELLRGDAAARERAHIAAALGAPQTCAA